MVYELPENEIDELDPIVRRVRNLETKFGTISVTSDGFVGLLPADGREETAVRIEIPSKSGGTIFAQCVVIHNGTEVIDVRLPDGHGALAEAAGITWEAATEWEGYLCILARMAFARGGR